MIPLEDGYLDILGKAQRGLRVTDDILLEKSGLSVEQLQHIRNGNVDVSGLQKIAPILQLNASALVASAQKAWMPQSVSVPHFKIFTTPFDESSVNAYLAWDAVSKEAVAFDTGTDAGEMMEFAKLEGLCMTHLLITHTHGDHIFDMDRLVEKTGAQAYVGDREPLLEGATAFSSGKTFQIGSLKIETRLTWGHCKGGITYVIHGLARPVAVVGDALFAGSMGGGMISWLDALQTTRDEILSLPVETVVASGHGPLTTVAESRQHNPFFTF